MFTETDCLWMAEALRLAELGLYGTSPNPRVGCVLVMDGKSVGSGWHRRAGEAHAEVHALNEAGTLARGATLYVTLEPCSHHGRTPPCADALIKAGVTRVVAAMQDPNPEVAGAGLALLHAAGIAVESGLMESQARNLNAGFFTRMTRATPWLRSKIAMSLDGRTALANGQSQWITGNAARLDVQRWRARSCAVLTGIGTILADDARLNVRGIDTFRQPLRVLLDSQLRIPLDARWLNTGAEPAGATLIYTAIVDRHKIARLQKLGATVRVLPNSHGQVDLPTMLNDLAFRGCNEVLVEAGSTLNGALLDAGLIDELLLYMAPQLLGDTARCMARLGELQSLDQRIALKWQDVRQIGADLRILLTVEKDKKCSVES